jgi:thymidylate synthase (FAD)
MKKAVLDHGFVRLVSYMQPVPVDIVEDPGDAEVDFPDVRKARQEGWTGDLEIVRNARVSFNADWRTEDELEHEPTCNKVLLPEIKLMECDCKPKSRSDSKLIHYLYDNKHTSPFEAMVFTFEVKAPIFILRQWHRHRTWSYNELSARYGEMPGEFYIPLREHIGKQDAFNKQSRSFARQMAGEQAEIDRQNRIVEGMRTRCQQQYEYYRALLGEGVPRELARAVLPLNMYSRMFATVDLHNLFHFLRLRMHSHAQFEIRMYAHALLDLIEPIVPHAVHAFSTQMGTEVAETP